MPTSGAPLKVSILIPTYNRAAYLEQAVSSALAQTYPHLEVVVSDNASVDGTPAVGEKFSRDSRVRWHRNPANIGLAPNWEKLLYELAQGDFVKILADDDYLDDPEHVAKAVRLIEEHGLRAVFARGRALVLPAGELKEVDPDLPLLLTPSWWMDHFAGRVGGKPVFPALVGGGIFDRREAIRFGAFRDTVFGTDVELALQLMLSGPTAYLGGHQHVLRYHPDNDGNVAPLEVVLTSLQLFERVRAFGRGLGLPEEQLSALCRRGLTLFARNFIVRSWLRRHGLTPRSWAGLYRALAAVDRRAALAVILDPTPVFREVLRRDSLAYRAARGVYRSFNGLRAWAANSFHGRGPS